jgi:hypothetical protein
MKAKPLMILKRIFFISLVLLLASGCSFSKANKRLYRLPSSVSVSLDKNDKDKWGISIEQDGKAFLGNSEPVDIEIFADGKVGTTLKSGYDSFKSSGGNFIATGFVEYSNVRFIITDTWSQMDGILRVDRKMEVEGDLTGGFMSGVFLSYYQTAKRDKVKIFAPGMIYGGTGNLTPAAIGGSDCTDFVRIREDRLPAPMNGIIKLQALENELYNKMISPSTSGKEYRYVIGRQAINIDGNPDES